MIDSLGQMACTQNGHFCLYPITFWVCFSLIALYLNVECAVLAKSLSVSVGKQIKSNMSVCSCVHADTAALSNQVVPVFHLEPLTLLILNIRTLGVIEI